MLNTYLILIQRVIIKALTYRARLALWFFLDIIPLGVLIIVWISVYANTQQIGSYTLDMIIQYYFLVMIVNGLTSNHFEQTRVKEIREGKIDYFMIRPLNYLAEITIGAAGFKLVYAGILLSISAALWFVFQFWLDLMLSWPSPTQLVLFLGLIVVGYVIDFMLGLLIVLMGFWFEHADGLEHFKWLAVSLFSGLLFPLEFMPAWLANIVNVLPFKYIMIVPIGILQGTQSLSSFDLLYLTGFFSLMILLLYTVWRKAIYRYASAGG